jgi:hypothetical protein
MRKFNLQPGRKHIHKGKLYYGPCEIEMEDDDYKQMVGTVMDTRKQETDVFEPKRSVVKPKDE